MLTDRQRWLHWSLWKKAKNMLMHGRETWTKDEDNRRRHDLYTKALGHDKSLTKFTNADLDLVIAEFNAIIEPGNLDAQLRQIRMPRRRAEYRLKELMAELGVGHNYVAEIVHRMNENGQLASNEIDNLDAEELKKVVIALRKHQTRGGGVVREYVLKPITVVMFIAWLGLTGCVIGRLDSDRLRLIPISEVHRMDDKGFPLDLFQHDCQP